MLWWSFPVTPAFPMDIVLVSLCLRGKFKICRGTQNPAQTLQWIFQAPNYSVPCTFQQHRPHKVHHTLIPVPAQGGLRASVHPNFLSGAVLAHTRPTGFRQYRSIASVHDALVLDTRMSDLTPSWFRIFLSSELTIERTLNSAKIRQMHPSYSPTHCNPRS